MTGESLILDYRRPGPDDNRRPYRDGPVILFPADGGRWAAESVPTDLEVWVNIGDPLAVALRVPGGPTVYHCGPTPAEFRLACDFLHRKTARQRRQDNGSGSGRD